MIARSHHRILWQAVRCCVLIAPILLALGAAEAHERLRVQIDTALQLNLSKPAATVVLGNPVIAGVTVESPTMIFLFGLQAGETNLIILDDDGNSLLSSQLVVVPADERVVTVHRNVVEVTYSCDPRCAQILTPNPVSGNPAPPATASPTAEAAAKSLGEGGAAAPTSASAAETSPPAAQPEASAAQSTGE